MSEEFHLVNGLVQAHSKPGWDCHLHVFDSEAARLPGHYEVQTHSLPDLQITANPCAVSRFVLVQPSVYGRDNSVLLEALRASAGLHRGVVVVDGGIDEVTLRAMHALGVRGVRFNRVSPVGRHADVAAVLQELAPKLQALGWHVQWFVEAQDLVHLPAWQRACKLPFVLDHVASMHAGMRANDPAWAALQALGESGTTWMKLSAWYRLQAASPYDAMDANVQRLLPWFARRMVWGSDWPHTGIAKNELPHYPDLLAPLARLFSTAEREDILHDAPTRLYG